jgi:hypothetical protein
MATEALVPCSSCGRHVREQTCPFCGAGSRAGRAIGTLAAAATVALLQGCYGGPPPGYRDVREPAQPQKTEDVAPPSSTTKSQPDGR